MINWKDLNNLRVVLKLREILDDWFGVELFWVDHKGVVRSCHRDEGYEHSNNFIKIQWNEMTLGWERMEEDIEKAVSIMNSSNVNSQVFDSSFSYVKGVCSPVVTGGEFVGGIFAYPFIQEDITELQYSNIWKQMKKLGASDSNIDLLKKSQKKLNAKDIKYLKELVELVSAEIVTFYEEITKREDRINELNSELGEKFRYGNMIGKSKGMQKVYGLLEKISNSDSSVFIQGENGTGKELVAKAIHYSSPRKDRIFLAVNCSAFNDNLLDSELFGHEKGSFTGAHKSKQGVFEVANGGTLFLDEIGDTSLSMQVKLLRVLQEGTFIPVGGTTSKRTDVRIITATNKNIKEMMEKGEFREDLFYRINVINVQLPPLRERIGDIPVLMDYF